MFLEGTMDFIIIIIIKGLNSLAAFRKISASINVIKRKHYRFEFLWFSP